jgi:hypothetical protein
MNKDEKKKQKQKQKKTRYVTPWDADFFVRGRLVFYFYL